MAKLVIRPVVEHLLVIDGDYGDEYRAILTIEWLGLDKVFISGFKGEMSRAEYQEFFELMKKRGVKEVESERHGKRRIQRIG